MLGISAGWVAVHEPILGIAAAATLFIFAILRAGILPLLTLGVLATLAPLHGLLLELQIPAWWKEALAACLLLMAVPWFFIRRIPLLFLFLLFVMAALSAAILNGRFSSYDLAPYIAFVPLGIAIPFLVRNERQIHYVIAGLLAGSAVDAVIVILAQLRDADIVQGYVFQSSFQGELRPASYAGPNLLTGTLLGVGGGLVVAWLILRRRDSSRFLTTCMTGLGILLVIGAVMSLARAAIFAIGVGLVAAYFMRLVQARTSSGRGAALPITLAVSVVVLMAAFFSTDSLLASRFTLGSVNEKSDETRIDRWRSGLETAAESPLFGKGPGYTGRSRVIEALGTTSTYHPDTLDVPISESNWVKILAETGLLGAFTAIGLVVAAIRRLWRTAAAFNSAAITLITLIILLAHGLVYQSMESYIGSGLFWGCIGLAGAYEQMARSAETKPPDSAVE